MGITRTQFSALVIAVALISLSVLTFEIVLTRIFSVMLSYHYVFAVISFALLGLGFGGMMLKEWFDWFPKSDVNLLNCDFHY